MTSFPDVPLGNQFTHPAKETAGDMASKVDARLNQLRTAMNTFGVGLASLRVTQRAAAGLTNGAAVTFDTTITDTAGGWNAASGLYTIPDGGGLFLVQFQLVQSTAVSFTAQIVGLPAGVYNGGIRSTACKAGAGDGPTIPLVPIWFSGGEQISVVPSFSGSVSLAAAPTNDVSYLSIGQFA